MLWKVKLANIIKYKANSGKQSDAEFISTPNLVILAKAGIIGNSDKNAPRLKGCIPSPLEVVPSAKIHRGLVLIPSATSF